MRLHRSISTDHPLLVVALDEEAAGLHDFGLPVLITGVGKVNAAVAVSTVLGDHSPSRIINLGTAGSLREGLSGVHVISQVRQHDLDDDAIHTLTGLHFSQPIELADAGAVLTTGDVFVNDRATRAQLAEHADLVDMEGYAVAKAAAASEIPMTLVKVVSDPAGEESLRTWRETIDDCAAQLGTWLQENLER